MGIISSALAAAGDAGVQSMNQNIQQLNQQELDKQRSDLETQKQLAIMQAQKQLTIDTANQMRQAQMDRIAAAKGATIQSQTAQQYAPSDEAVAAANAGQTDAPLTDDQAAVIAQSKSLYQQQLANDPQSYIAAAIQSGDIAPDKVAEIAHGNAVLKQNVDLQQQRLDAESDAQDQREEAARNLQKDRQSFEAGQNSLSRAQEDKRMRAMYGDSGAISDQEKANWVHTYVVSNGTVPRSAPAVVRNNIGTWAAQMGISPDDIAKGTAKQKYDQSSAATAGHRAGTMAGVEAALPALADNAIDLSKQVGNSRFVPLNKLMMMADDSISDPNLASFKAANQALASEYQQVISRGGSNVFALREAMDVLNRASSPEAYEAAVNQVKREVSINTNAMNNVRNNIGGAHGSSTVANPLLPSTPGAALTYDPKTGTFH